MAEHNDLGIKGEKIALNYLQKKGYTILEKNYRFGHLEIDIIASRGEQLIIVEVKTRQSHYLAGPEITVNKNKQKAIIRVANAYIQQHEWNGETQFDIISIIIEKGKTQLEHLEDAFYPVH